MTMKSYNVKLKFATAKHTQKIEKKKQRKLATNYTANSTY